MCRSRAFADPPTPHIRQFKPWSFTPTHPLPVFPYHPRPSYTSGKFQKQGVRSLAFSPIAPLFAVGLTDTSIEILDQWTRKTVGAKRLKRVLERKTSQGVVAIAQGQELLTTVQEAGWRGRDVRIG